MGFHYEPSPSQKTAPHAPTQWLENKTRLFPLFFPPTCRNLSKPGQQSVIVLPRSNSSLHLHSAPAPATITFHPPARPQVTKCLPDFFFFFAHLSSSVSMVSVCLPSDDLLQHLPSYLGFSYLGHGVSLHGCSSKVQPLLLTLDVGYLLIAVLPELQCGIAPLGTPVPAQPLH